MIQKTMNRGNIPNVSAASVTSDGHFFINIGKASGKGQDIFCLGSVSKSFTGYGIMLLASRNELYLEDSVTTYIPWFTAMYKGENVADKIKISDLVYQTSGYTNDLLLFPSADAEMSLEDYIRSLSGSALAQEPSAQFAYANANYCLLGYIIEKVTGESYASYMKNEIFVPLGLTSTFAEPPADGVVSGTRIAFRRAWRYSPPVSPGSVPAGYIYSDIADLTRWLGLHMGIIEAPDGYGAALEAAHVPGPLSDVGDGSRYAAGWFVNDETGLLYHSGGTEAYSSCVVFSPSEQLAACALANINLSENTTDIAHNIIRILQGNGGDIVFSRDIWTTVDVIFTVACVAAALCMGLLIFITRRKRRRRRSYTGLWYLIPAIAIILSAAAAAFLPGRFGVTWQLVYVWAPLSIFAAVGAVFLLGVVSFFLVRWLRKKRRNVF